MNSDIPAFDTPALLPLDLPPLELKDLHYNLGCVLHQQGDWVSAAQSYQQAIALAPGYANAHLNLAIVLDEQGKRPLAIRHYRQAIALDPSSVKAYNNLGCALVKLGQVEDAIQVYQQAIALHPNWAILYNNLGQALAAQGDVPASLAAYRQAIALQPNVAIAHHNIGKTLQGQGHHAAAIEYFQKVIQLEPDNALAHADCGFSWMATGTIDRSIPHFQNALQLHQAFIQAYIKWTEGLSHFNVHQPNQLNQPDQSDELTQARIACGRFLRSLLCQSYSSTVDPQLYKHLADTYLHLASTLMIYGGESQYQQAQTYYQWVLRLQPDHAVAYSGLVDCLSKLKKPNAAILISHLARAACSPSDRSRFDPDITLHRHSAPDPAPLKNPASIIQNSASPIVPSHAPTSSQTRSQRRSPYRPIRLSPSTQDWIRSTQYPDARYIPLSPPSSSAPPSLPSASQSSCQGLNCVACLQNIVQWFEPQALSKGIYRCTLPDRLPVEPYPLFVATVPNGRVWITPQQNNWLVCNAIAILTPDNTLLADVSRDYPGQLPGCTSSLTTHRMVTQEHLPTPEAIHGTVAVLAGLSGHNYYHWMVDILPRLELLRRSGLNFAEIDWFLINYNGSAFQQTTLEQLGIPIAKVLSSDRHSHIHASRLIVPSFPSYLGWLDSWAVEFLRQRFLPLAAYSNPPFVNGTSTRHSKHLDRNFPDRIYLSRAQANHRRVLNEPEIIEYLDSLGFVCAQLESMSVADQIALFANAKFVVAPHGGGLTNIVFCRSGTTIIELVSPHYIRHYFWLISQHLHLNHYLITGEALTCYPLRQLMYPNPLMEDIWINLTQLKTLLAAQLP